MFEKKKIVIPAGMEFAELELERAQFTGRLLYKPEPLAAMFSANSIDVSQVFENEELADWLIAEWYLAHRAAGGERDPVAEEVFAEGVGSGS